MKQFIFIVVGILILAGIGVGIFFAASEEPDGVKNGKTEQPGNANKAPAFVLENYDGETVSSGDFLGKPHILNSWAAWCPFCVEELNDFAKLQEEFGDQLRVVAINRAEGKSKAQKYTDDLGVTDTMTFLLDPRDSFYKSIGGFSMPETLFVNAEGEIVRHKRGPMQLSEMRQAVEDLFSL